VIASHAGTPVSLTIRRDGTTRTVSATPFKDTTIKPARYRIGFGQEASKVGVGPVDAAGTSVSNMWYVTSTTVSHIVQIFKPQDRKELGSVVGGYETTRQAFKLKTSYAFMFLAIISLSLGIVNLFPFLPLDGGHIFWALAEKVRGRAIPFSVMERAGFIGFALVIMLFAIGFTNDIGRLTGEGFGLPK
jgi:regulator of sigma E protease